MCRKEIGFTLVEIIVVVGIITTAAALGIPNLMRSRVNANEASAAASVRIIVTAAHNYRGFNPLFPADLSALASANPPYIDSVLGSGSKQGYNYVLTGTNINFVVTAAPTDPGITGNRYFFADETGLIRAATGGPADATSPAIE